MSVEAACARHDPRHYTPPDLPPDLRRMAGRVVPLDVGAPGKVGLLELEMAPVAGKTRITRRYQQAPLYIFSPLYIDPARPDMAFVYLLHQGGGIVQGDRYRFDLVCKPGVAAHVTTQAATKLYRMERDFATQWTEIAVGADAVLEYLPDPVIPFRDARFHQRTRLVIDPTATAIVGETLLPGRVAYGERHAYTLFTSRTDAVAPDGSLLFADRIAFDPTRRPLQTPGRLGPYDVFATLFVAAPRPAPAELVARLRAALAPHADVLAGASELPNQCGAAVRILGPSSLPVKRAFDAAWRAARLATLGVPPPDRRKG
ncbi:MAG TPA: urease accessory protein UreD [Thermomicrobiales bacterium]|nr:urease accessory protein UreD [Thermomicrobiales bacterium]